MGLSFARHSLLQVNLLIQPENLLKNAQPLAESSCCHNLQNAKKLL
jgi:hypothetical protein